MVSLNLSALGSIAAILQLLVTSYLSWKVYKLTQEQLELEEYDQKPGKISVLTTKADNQPKGFTNFSFKVKNDGEGRTKITKYGFPMAKLEDGEIIKANTRSTVGTYQTPLILDPGESFEIKGQFKNLDLDDISSVGIEVFSQENPRGFRFMTTSGAGNF